MLRPRQKNASLQRMNNCRNRWVMWLRHVCAPAFNSCPFVKFVSASGIRLHLRTSAFIRVNHAVDPVHKLALGIQVVRGLNRSLGPVVSTGEAVEVRRVCVDGERQRVELLSPLNLQRRFIEAARHGQVESVP